MTLFKQNGLPLGGSLALALALVLAPMLRAEPPAKSESDVDDGSFTFSEPIICLQIIGFEDYEKRANNILTKDEKLLLYFVPAHYKSEKVAKKYEARFSEDIRIRKKGSKTPLWSRDKFAEYKAFDQTAPEFIFLKNTISLKPFKPGDYELELILHDLVDKDAKAVRTVPFKIVDSTYKPPESEKPEPSKEDPGS